VPVCRALSVHGIQIAPRTYWAYLSRAPSKRELWDATVAEIMAGIYERGEDGRRPPESMYGTLKMREFLQRQGIPVAKCTVERLKNANGWHGRARGRRLRTTIADPAASRAPDLVNRQFRPQRPGQLHVADFTYVPLATGRFCYTAFVIDAFAGLIPGWECSASKETQFVESALRQAMEYRKMKGQLLGPGAIRHSGAGSQYTSTHFTETLMLAGLAPSIGTVGDAYDCESFHATIKKDLLHRSSWPTKAAARSAVFDYIETFYNPRRRHSTLGNLSPALYETQYQEATRHNHEEEQQAA